MDILARHPQGRGRRARRRRRSARAVPARPDARAWTGWPTVSACASIPERTVTYIIDRNVNYTNVCVARCNFCAFYRDVGSSEGYVLGFDEIFRKIDETIEVGGVQLLLQGGHNPDLPLDLVRRSVSGRQGAVSGLQAARVVAAGSHPPVAAVAAHGARGRRSVDRRGPRQHSWRGSGDSRRSRATASPLLRQGDLGRVARRDAPRAPPRACARRRR